MKNKKSTTDCHGWPRIKPFRKSGGADLFAGLTRRKIAWVAGLLFPFLQVFVDGIEIAL
jgi:hypothetical protein